MICPLPRAHDLTAPTGPAQWDSRRGGGAALPELAVERAMKVQEVILRAMSERQPWIQVADV